MPNDLQIRKNIIGAIDDNIKILLKENKEESINSIVEKLGEEMLGIWNYIIYELSKIFYL